MLQSGYRNKILLFDIRIAQRVFECRKLLPMRAPMPWVRNTRLGIEHICCTARLADVIL
jgi:hypothetical protein